MHVQVNKLPSAVWKQKSEEKILLKFFDNLQKLLHLCAMQGTPAIQLILQILHNKRSIMMLTHQSIIFDPPCHKWTSDLKWIRFLSRKSNISRGGGKSFSFKSSFVPEESSSVDTEIGAETKWEKRGRRSTYGGKKENYFRLSWRKNFQVFCVPISISKSPPMTDMTSFTDQQFQNWLHLRKSSTAFLLFIFCVKCSLYQLVSLSLDPLHCHHVYKKCLCGWEKNAAKIVSVEKTFHLGYYCCKWVILYCPLCCNVHQFTFSNINMWLNPPFQNAFVTCLSKLSKL